MRKLKINNGDVVKYGEIMEYKDFLRRKIYNALHSEVLDLEIKNYQNNSIDDRIQELARRTAETLFTEQNNTY